MDISDTSQHARAGFRESVECVVGHVEEEGAGEVEPED